MDMFMLQLKDKKKWINILILLCIYSFCLQAKAKEVKKSNNVIARGRGVVITQSDVEAMKNYLPSFYKDEKFIKKTTICTVLMAKTAKDEGLVCKSAKSKTGFAKTYALSLCYYNKKFSSIPIQKDTIQSYYLAHWKRFLNSEGKLISLDKSLREQIKTIILKSKGKNFFAELCQKLIGKYGIKGLE